MYTCDKCSAILGVEAQAIIAYPPKLNKLGYIDLKSPIIKTPVMFKVTCSNCGLDHSGTYFFDKENEKIIRRQ